MASYTNRGTKSKPSWQYTISRYVNGKYSPIRKGGFRTKAEAQAEAEEIERKLKREEKIFLDPIPFSEYFEKWYKLYKTHIKNQTLRHYKYTLKIIKEHFEDKPIQRIRRDDYQLFLNEIGQKYSKETTLKIQSHIKSCLEHAVEDGIIRFNFARNVVVTGKPPVKDRNEKHLNYVDSEKLYDELFKRLDEGISYYAALLLLVSGMRFEELVGLTRNDFDFNNNTITINKVWGYNNHMSEGFGPTKNPQSVRTISIDPNVMKEFKKLFITLPDNIHRLVFFSGSSKYKVLSNNAVNKSLKKAQKAVGIKNIVTAHGLRHTHASALIYKKASLIYVSERLGHSSPETTYRKYLHVMNELREEDDQIAINLY